MVKDGWDWNKKVRMMYWHALAQAGYPDWELTTRHIPARVNLVVTKGQGKSSREMAIEWDDLATGAFYYRDWTDRSLPFVDASEVYRSAFAFQRLADAEAFQARYGGTREV